MHKISDILLWLLNKTLKNLIESHFSKPVSKLLVRVALQSYKIFQSSEIVNCVIYARLKKLN